MTGEIRSLFIPGRAGRLEALLNTGAPEASHAALVCHPHPLHGGTMHNKVVFAAMKALNGLGLPALRFNFRGAGMSEGRHDRGRGEQDDVRAALDWLEREFRLPIIFAGFSFGAVTGMKACCPDPRVPALVALGTPITAEERGYSYPYLAHCSKPKLFISGTQDEFAPKAQLEQVLLQAAPPKKVVWVEGADHFFQGKLSTVREAIESWVKNLIDVRRN